jgi:hypothetical protein
MVTFSSAVEQIRNEFKTEVFKVLDDADTNLTQAQIAGLLVCSEACVSRWLSIGHECNLPAFTLGFLPARFSLPLLAYLAKHHNATVTRRIPIIGKLNGSILDELTGMVSGCGKLADHVKEGKLSPQQCRKVLHHIIAEATKAEAEVDVLEHNGAHP